MTEPVVVMQNIGGLQTGTCVLGEGTPILALHGWGGAIKSFWPVAEALAPLGYQVHMLDLPGFGKTDHPPDTWSVADYTRFVVQYLDANGLNQVNILGHSFGGRISLILAADYADRVQKMVLADAAGLRTPPTLRQHVRMLPARMIRGTLELLGMTAVSERLRARYNQRFGSEDYLNAGALRETFLQVINQDLTEFATRVQAPTVLIWGDQDTDTPLWQGRKLEQLIPDAALIVFQSAGHFSYLEHLHQFVRITDHFFSDRS
ncbi:MAG: alpha/beta hydrolase [Anaerolineae bacterium]|nr:alpha/beta hydrolase [Anaerolineae bacterium]